MNKTAFIIFLAFEFTQCAPQRTSNEISEGIVSQGCPQGYECIPHYLCGNSSIITNGENVIDIRNDEDECPSFLDVCCSTGDKKNETPANPTKQLSKVCGLRNVDGIGFKITGDEDNETQYGEFPWMVAVFKTENKNHQTLIIYQCGGSLIHPSVVLTAAHCVFAKPAEILGIRAGEWDTQTKSELFPHQNREVEEIVTHEQYNKGSLYNDIALLFLTAPVELAENVRTVCLPPAKLNFDFARCFATGWGKDIFENAGRYQTIMKKIDLPIVPRDLCQSTFRSTRLGKYFNLHRSFICAGGENGKDTCTGDGGSPLVCPIAGKHEQYFQAGIVAWGIGCGDNIPGAYASVAELRSWIDEQLSDKKIDSKYYTP